MLVELSVSEQRYRAVAGTIGPSGRYPTAILYL
jgi:hypothetical protein